MSVSRFHIVVAAALILSGCAHGTPPVVERIVEVDKPVAIQPIKPEQIPALPPALGPRPGSLSQAADALLASHCEFVAYLLVADPLLAIAAGTAARALPDYAECKAR